MLTWWFVNLTMVGFSSGLHEGGSQICFREASIQIKISSKTRPTPTKRFEIHDITAFVGIVLCH